MRLEVGGQALNTHLNLADHLRDGASLIHLDLDEGGSVSGWYRGAQ